MKPKRQPEKESPFASTWVELAAALGITNRGLLLVRNRMADAPDMPKKRSDNRHVIDDWKSFFRAHNIEGRKMDAEASGSDETSPATWKARQIEQQVIKLQLANELTRRQQVAMTEIQSKLSSWMMSLRTEMSQIVPDLTQSLEGIDDYYEREEIIDTRINKALVVFQSAPWMDEEPLELQESNTQ